MTTRAEASGIRLALDDARQVLGMLERGDRQHDIAAWFGVNPGRIAEVKARELFPDAQPAPPEELPPPGPYHSGRAAAAAVHALEEARNALDLARARIETTLIEIRGGRL
jgi:hypothetical protein